ncbi:MAG TPA: GNAT family N-acetyltransferase [Tepidisphaeraceae bacterium]|nr:GNAT family N-acetyltransferase [Tepidisphaeraceae bacterium]
MPTLCPASADDRLLLKNLFLFYRYDLSPYLPDSLNPEGLLSDDPLLTTHDASLSDLDIWWTKPACLFPHLIRHDSAPVGFAMITKPPHASPDVDYRIEDFFILNRYRRTGLGSAAASQIFRQYPGICELAWLPLNTPAAHFWQSLTTRLDLPAHAASIPYSPATPPLPGLRITIPNLFK